MAALWSLTWFIPYLGLLPMMLVFVDMMLTSFFTSHYLNQIIESHQRATVLSFKGLAFNAAYGMIGILYAGLIQHLRQDQQLQHPQWSAALIENEAFRQSIGWFPWYMLAMIIFITLIWVRSAHISTLPTRYSRHNCSRKSLTNGFAKISFCVVVYVFPFLASPSPVVLPMFCQLDAL